MVKIPAGDRSECNLMDFLPVLLNNSMDEKLEVEKFLQLQLIVFLWQ
jgi:hypothetical protein